MRSRRTSTPRANSEPKLQALQALSLFGERAATQVDKVVPLLSDGEPIIVTAALTTLAAMGTKGRPAFDALEKTEKYWAEKLETARSRRNSRNSS